MKSFVYKFSLLIKRTPEKLSTEKLTILSVNVSEIDKWNLSITDKYKICSDKLI